MKNPLKRACLAPDRTSGVRSCLSFQLVSHWPHSSKKEDIMPIYIDLFKFTDQGIRDIKDVFKR